MAAMRLKIRISQAFHIGVYAMGIHLRCLATCADDARFHRFLHSIASFACVIHIPVLNTMPVHRFDTLCTDLKLQVRTLQALRPELFLPLHSLISRFPINNIYIYPLIKLAFRPHDGVAPLC